MSFLPGCHPICQCQNKWKEHTHTFNDPLSGTTRVSWYQKGKTNLDFTEARDSEWQWNPLGYVQVCTRSRQITTPAPHHSVFYRPDALPAAQPTVSKRWRHQKWKEHKAVKAQIRTCGLSSVHPPPDSDSDGKAIALFKPDLGYCHSPCVASPARKPTREA